MNPQKNYTLRSLCNAHHISDAQYDLLTRIINHHATPNGRTNNLLISSSDAARTILANAIIEAYTAHGNPLILVQDFNRFYARNALTFTYDEIDYPYCKLSKTIKGYQCIIADSLPLYSVSMQLLTAINLYPLSIVLIEADSVSSAFNLLYQTQSPSFQKYQSITSMLKNCFINNLFDYVFLLDEKRPLSAYEFQRTDRITRITDWKTALKPIG